MRSITKYNTSRRVPDCVTFVVPFDGSDLAETALVRATEFGRVLDERVLAITIIPEGNQEYSRDHGWLRAEEAYDLDTTIARVHRQVTEACPSADFQHRTVGRHAPPGRIAIEARKAAKSSDASMVFVGSENAGHVVTTRSSVGGSIAADEAYDVGIIRHKKPSKNKTLREISPHHKSDFYPTTEPQ